MRYFLFIEVIVFYALVLTVMIFLIYIQIRGVLGKKIYEANTNRFKFDAIDYYKIDIDWLSF